ncbi:MAG: hypothetical protein KUG78_20990, partial [Kangiellaceae bacterium]|nr:hypothetical protein [Kangiellaceae bacterium]
LTLKHWVENLSMARSSKLIFPESKNDFLSEMLMSFKKRSKSLKHKTIEISIERIFEEYDEGRIERIELEIETYSSNNSKICLNIYQDRWVSVNCWERTKNEKWDWFYEGKLLPIVEGQKFVEAVEESLSSFYQMNQDKVEKFSAIWMPLLARGPELVI